MIHADCFLAKHYCHRLLSSYYSSQKKNLEVNPRHPLIKTLKQRVDSQPDDQTTKDLAMVLFETATLRSGYALRETAGFADRIERMLRLSMDISLDEPVRSSNSCSSLGHIGASQVQIGTMVWCR